MQEVIKLANITFDYGDGPIFKNIDFCVREGDFLAVIGPNGAGKTTLLRIMAGILTPQTGVVSLFGEKVNKFDKWGDIGYVPQNPAKQDRTFPISVREVVSLGLVAGRSLWHRQTNAEKQLVEKTLKNFHLDEFATRKIGELSGGQQQRVFMARAMINNPKLLMLDEPATGIDEDSKYQLYNLLKELNEKGVTIVMISHDLELAAATVKKAICVDHGICFYGDAQAALKHRHKGGYFYR